ncbi:MAG: peptide chain release factor N(5)-glutamine methyltransferase [Treponema sp.]|jgi:release factor glutamine methyltransferase|nr:peptide chain release factor N(5)-glutamine methyltransferase [Treponema sp.]
MTLRETQTCAAAFLKDAGIESYALDAAALLSYVLNVSKTRLALDAENQIKYSDYKKYQKLLERRAGGECTAYIINKKEFRFLEFYVDKNTLVPRPDTETLVEAALCRVDKLTKIKKEIQILDICTGSGAVALSLKYERPSVKMTASDISAGALAAARKNAEIHKLQHDIQFIQTDVFENITRRFDIITANAPYIPHEQIKTLQAEVQNEPIIALDGGKDGLEIIRRIVSGAAKHLFADGCIFLEAAPEQMSEIAALLIDAGFDGIEIKQDISGADRVIAACLSRHSQEWGAAN